MSDAIEPPDDLLEGLTPVGEGVFPRRCPSCARTFSGLSEYLEQTRAMTRNSGLMAAFDDQKRTAILLLRNCGCGALVAVFCEDRRGRTETAIRRRVSFGRLMEMLVEAGMDEHDARAELLSTFGPRAS